MKPCCCCCMGIFLSKKYVLLGLLLGAAYLYAPAGASAFEAATPYIGSIEMWAGTWAPKGWVYCNGQILQIANNEALFSLIGNVYGGDGVETFALPDLRGRIPVGVSGNGSFPEHLGQTGGSNEVWIGPQQAGVSVKTAKLPPDAFSESGTARVIVTDKDDSDIPTKPLTIGIGQAHDNLQPYLPISYIIALDGMIPARRN